MSIIFVGGVNRSGTTLLQSILCSDSATNPLVPEASYLRFIVSAWEFNRRQFDSHTRFYFNSSADLKAFSARWLKEFLDNFRQRYPGAKHLVLRHLPTTPEFPALYELMLEAGEDARFIVSVRDPRDVVASLVRVGEKARAKGDPVGASLQRNMQQLCKVFLDVYGPLLACNRTDFREKLMLLRYEDLVTEPDASLARLRNATGLKLSGFKATEDWARNDMDIKQLEKTSVAPWVSDLWGKGISKARLGSYREILTLEEIRTVEGICAKAMAMFGYTES